MNSILLPIGVVACAIVGAALWLWPAELSSAAPPLTTHSEPSVTTTESAELNARWTAPKVIKNPEPEAKRNLVKLPTGEYVQALNGAVGAPPLSWPVERPYSPIIGIEHTPGGKDWWVHADGSKSMTDMVFRSDLGRLDAITQVANPTPALPFHPDDLERAKKEQENAVK